MALFFLHIRNGDQLIPDPDGAELADLDAARAEARRATQELVNEGLVTRRTAPSQSIEIWDDAGNQLEVVPIEDVLGPHAAN